MKNLVDTAAIAATRFDDLMNDFVIDLITDLGVDYEQPNLETIEAAAAAIKAVKYIDAALVQKSLNMLENLKMDI